MYIPSHFAETDSGKLRAFIEQNNFAILISQHGEEPFASHLPLLLRQDEGPNGALIGHVAKANPHWQLADGKSVLAIFAGPHAYISPSWYEADHVVPTWNYVAVHAYGIFRVIADESERSALLRDSLTAFEDPGSPYTIDLDGDFAAKLQRQIVAFRIEISRIEGKWKLNQNHPRERREKVMNALRRQTDGGAHAIADLIQESLG